MRCRSVICLFAVAGPACTEAPPAPVAAPMVEPPPPPPPPPPPEWPNAGAPLTPPSVSVPAAVRAQRVFIEAGHGAPGNTGNTSSWCLAEEDVTRALASDLGDRLLGLGPWQVRLAREGEDRPAYRTRIRAAEGWSADALISIHSDIRGAGRPWQPPGMDRTCLHNDTQPGFSVLWSDEGAAGLVSARRDLARALGQRMAEAGLTPYRGNDYVGLYSRPASG